MLKKIVIACVATFALTTPAKADLFDSFDSSSFGGSVGLSPGGISVDTGNGAFGAGATIGPGGVRGGFGGEGFGGTFNQNGVSVGTDLGISGTIGSNGGYFNGPGGISGNFNQNGGGYLGVPGANLGFPGGNIGLPGMGGQFGSNGYQLIPTSMSATGNAMESGANTGEQNHSAYNYTRGYQTQETQAIGRTTANNQQSVVQGTRNLDLPDCKYGGMARVFGY